MNRNGDSGSGFQEVRRRAKSRDSEQIFGKEENIERHRTLVRKVYQPNKSEMLLQIMAYLLESKEDPCVALAIDKDSNAMLVASNKLSAKDGDPMKRRYNNLQKAILYYTSKGESEEIDFSRKELRDLTANLPKDVVSSMWQLGFSILINAFRSEPSAKNVFTSQPIYVHFRHKNGMMVHAETRLVDYLERESKGFDPTFIATSRLCCGNCFEFGKEMSRKNSYQFEGSHTNYTRGVWASEKSECPAWGFSDQSVRTRPQVCNLIYEHGRNLEGASLEEVEETTEAWWAQSDNGVPSGKDVIRSFAVLKRTFERHGAFGGDKSLLPTASTEMGPDLKSIPVIQKEAPRAFRAAPPTVQKIPSVVPKAPSDRSWERGRAPGTV